MHINMYLQNCAQRDQQVSSPSSRRGKQQKHASEEAKRQMITNVGVQGILMILVMVQVILVNDNSDDWEIVKEVERQLR